MQPGTESDDLDFYVFAEILVILRDICRVVEREVHRRRVVRIHLQDKVMQLLVDDGPVQHLLCGLLLPLRLRWRHDDEQRDENCRRYPEQVLEIYHHISPLIEFEWAISCPACQRQAAICMARQLSLAPSSVR